MWHLLYVTKQNKTKFVPYKRYNLTVQCAKYWAEKEISLGISIKARRAYKNRNVCVHSIFQNLDCRLCRKWKNIGVAGQYTPRSASSDTPIFPY